MELLPLIFGILRARQIASRAYAVSVKNSLIKNSMRSLIRAGVGGGDLASRWGPVWRYASSSLRRVVWCGVTTSSGLDRKRRRVRIHRWSHRITSRWNTGLFLVEVDNVPRHGNYTKCMWTVPVLYSHRYLCIKGRSQIFFEEPSEESITVIRLSEFSL